MNTSTSTNPTAEKALKILARGLDPACLDGEAEISALMFIRHCRRAAITLPALVTALAPVKFASAPERPIECDLTMEIGKHAGMTLEEIGRRHPGYLRWLSEEFNDEEISEGAAVVLGWLESRKRGAAA